MKKKNLNKRNKKYKILSVILFLITILFTITIIRADILPTKYFIILMIIVIIFDLFNIKLLSLKKLKTKVKGFISIFVIIAIIAMTILSIYLNKTVNLLEKNGESRYKTENYSVLVLKESNYNSIKDLKNKNIGYYKNTNKNALEKIKKKVIGKYIEEKSADEIVDNLLNQDIDAIILEDSMKSIIKEQNDSFSNSIREIYKFSIKIKTESTLKDVKVTKECFAIYISGIDTYGEISSVSRSDVNIVAFINPQTKQMLLISIPRDYYVQLHGTTGYKDKLTHAGIYGIDMSVKTIEDLLDAKINYYLKVNFTSVIDIVDALGGVDVYSEYTFTSYSGFSFKEGMNSVNGEQALDFARTRKAFKNGDRQRGINQQALIEAMMRKATSKAIITKYSSLLNSIDGKYQTNISYKKITSLIKMQLNDMSKWTINSYSLSGIDSYNYTYSYNQLLYVMEPDQDTIDEAKELIRTLLNNEKLENSYENISEQSKSNKVNKTNTSLSYNNSNVEIKTSSVNNSNTATTEDDKSDIDSINDINSIEEKDNENIIDNIKEFEDDINNEDINTEE